MLARITQLKISYIVRASYFLNKRVSWTAGKISVDRRSRGCNQAHSTQSHEVNNNDPVIIEQAVSGRPSETHRLSTHYITNLPTNTDPNNQHSANSLIIVTNHNATWLSMDRFMILMARVRAVYKTAARNVVLGGNLRDFLLRPLNQVNRNDTLHCLCKDISFAPSPFQI